MTSMRSVSGIFSATFIDPNPTPATSIIRAVDISELRSFINTLRTQNFGLSPFGFTDATIVVGVTPVKAVHFTELRTALNDTHVQAGVTSPSYTDPTITPSVTVIDAVHLNDLRNAVRTLE